MSSSSNVMTDRKGSRGYLNYFLFLNVFLLMACNRSGRSTLQEQKIIERSRPGYEIEVFDYNPLTDEVYYIERNTRLALGKEDQGKPSCVLRKYHLGTKEVKDVFTDFNIADTQSPWLQFSEEGRLLLYDVGAYDQSRKSSLKNSRIIVFEKDSIIDEIPVVAGVDLYQKESCEGDFLNWKEKRACSCKKIIKQSNFLQTIGHHETYKIRFRENHKPLPQFLLVRYQDEIFAMDVNDCGDSLFRYYQPQFPENKDSSHYLVKRSKTKNIFNTNLYVEKKETGTLISNFPCEKHYKVLHWNQETLFLEPCAKGFIEFPVSLRTVSSQGLLLYRKMDGIYSASPMR